MMPSPETWLLRRLREGVRVQALGCRVTFCSEIRGLLEVLAENGDVAEALLALAGRGIDSSRLTLIAARRDAFAGAYFEAHVDTLSRNGFLDYVWCAGGIERAVITGVCPNFEFSERALSLTTEITLSRFAYARRDGEIVILESPEAFCRIQFTCPAAWNWLGLFARRITIRSLLTSTNHCLADLANMLWSTGFLEESDVEESPNRASWDFHDLLFHWQTRAGRASGPQCGNFRFLGRWDAPEAVKPPMSATAIQLPAPRTAEEETAGHSLIGTLERRRSVREQGQQPVPIDLLARLLYHTARVKERVSGDSQELLLRPVPGAGAIHEIEFYLAIGHCDGLDRGLYHYHSEQHALYRLPATEDHVSALLTDAAFSWAKPEEPPQVLIIMSSRLPRMSWKYQGISYRLSLLNAGAIIQSFYLLATEMRLACSAIGGGDSMVFAAATGLDPLEETSIAEFAVGSLAPNTG